MAILKIIKGTGDWLDGNLIEATGARKDELVNGGFALIVTDDPKSEPKVDFEIKTEAKPTIGKKRGVR